MIQAIILKNIIPFVIGVITATAGIIGIQKMTQQSINLSCPPPQVKLSCPPPKIEGNGIDIEKIKGLKGKLTIEQHYHVEMDQDSNFTKRLTGEIREELERLKVVRCRK